MIQAVIFDMDGVIIDSHRGFAVDMLLSVHYFVAIVGQKKLGR